MKEKKSNRDARTILNSLNKLIGCGFDPKNSLFYKKKTEGKKEKSERNRVNFSHYEIEVTGVKRKKNKNKQINK